MGRLKGISPAVDSKLSTVCCGSHSQADKDGRGLQGTHPGPPYQPPTASSILSSKYPFQKLLFSATLAQNPEKLALLRLYHPILFSASDHTPSVKSWYHLPPTLVEYAVECSGENKPDVLLRLLTQRKLKKVLCFTNTKESVHLLCTYLSDHTQELVVGEYSSFVSKSQRGKSIIDFNTGRTDVLVCSDAMSRGMDLDQVECVVSYDAPSHFKTYVHRVGRTARAGKKGTAYTLLKHEEVAGFRVMLQQHSKPMPKKIKIKL
jgi:ATP-dependent RNA helicase DDX51/DBP6